MASSELDSRNIAITMRKSVENLVISSQDAIGQSISQALTFSGVIAHNNQNIQDNRSVSRSPSPSLRIPECGLDSLDNDKTSDSGILVAGLPASAAAGDSASVSSGELGPATPLSSTGRPEHPKSATPGTGKGSEGGGGSGRAKKKSWYNALYPTYKSKSEDFKRLFKDLPDEERLIVDYSCALQKDILVHGRLYASQSFLCFHASIFGWETSLMLRWKDVTAITKEKTALVIPNAILVCTEGEKHFITSFSGRDKAYLMLFRIWQNALMDQQMSSQDIWQWVHSCYGEELGFNSDEEGYSREAPDDAPALPPDSAGEDVGDSSCVEAVGGGADPREDHRRDRSVSHGRDSSPPIVENGDADYREEAGDTLPTDMSDTSDSEPDKPHNDGNTEKCPNTHEGKVILRQQVAFNIDQLFTMMFTNSKFSLELLAARGITDYVQSPWQAQGGRKGRQINYTMRLTSGPIGPKEVHITEMQTMNNCSKPGVQYSIDCTTDHSGIPYSDYFTVAAHYCLQRVSESVTELALYGQVQYKKSMFSMVKTFLEKNAMSGMEDFARLLETRLAAEAECAVPAARKSRRHRRVAAASSQETATAGGVGATVVAGGVGAARGALLAPRGAGGAVGAGAGGARGGGAGGAWMVGVLVALLALNAVLYWRLHHAPAAHLDIDYLQNRMSSASESQMAEWSRLLEQHARRQRGNMLAWRDALDRTVQHLAQTEQALTKLLETIKPSLERAEREAEASRGEL